MTDIKDMMDAQFKMQSDSFGQHLDEMSDAGRAEFIRWNTLALTDELHEALAECGWKPWATSNHLNEEAFKGELIDAWHFLMNLWLVAGGTPEEFVDGYFAKHDKNVKRQEEGYDGVALKCPSCKRALDDIAAQCYLPDPTTDGQGWCHETRKFYTLTLSS